MFFVKFGFFIGITCTARQLNGFFQKRHCFSDVKRYKFEPKKKWTVPMREHQLSRPPQTFLFFKRTKTLRRGRPRILTPFHRQHDRFLALQRLFVTMVQTRGLGLRFGHLVLFGRPAGHGRRVVVLFGRQIVLGREMRPQRGQSRSGDENRQKTSHSLAGPRRIESLDVRR